MRKLARTIALLCVIFMGLHFGNTLQAQDSTTFEIKNGNFVYNGQNIRIASGEMHYPRIPHQYWRHRLEMVKAMGLNCVATYVFWNLHEPIEGQWDFEGDKNLAEYIRIAGELGLHVILRPGPYVCAEWEFGGYPWWLQNVPDMELRRDNAQFLSYTQKYIERLYQEVGHLQVTQGGPIIMVQVENEFGSYANQRIDIPVAEHRSYNAKIKKQLEDAGFDAPKFTSDGSGVFDKGSIAGALPTANGENSVSTIKTRVNQYHGGKGPYMVAEFYTGWLAHWAEPHPSKTSSSLVSQTNTYWNGDVSFNYYMVHGGTNFGFTSGANYDGNHDIQPDLTTYDYDAPISEAGWVTTKYTALRNNLIGKVAYTVPEPPAQIPVIEIPSIKLTKVEDALAWGDRNEPAPVFNSQPMTFEELGQGYGYVTYTHYCKQAMSGLLNIPGLRDYAVVYVDGNKIGELNRYYKRYALSVNIPANSLLEIVVENMGRINYGAEIVRNTKGIISGVTIGGTPITDWQMIRMPMSEMPVLSPSAINPQTDNVNELQGRPLIYEGTFFLTDTGDTFLDMEAWGKGIVFINGINIGRYWRVGPQQTLYIPGVWLKKGENTIVIFEQLNNNLKKEVRTVKIPVINKLNTPN